MIIITKQKKLVNVIVDKFNDALGGSFVSFPAYYLNPARASAEPLR